ncbi:hypothetical protein NFHSH190041_18530 [Shewanella sp. NFH-SH190041]|uniref:hypothetical protein n=1 Tax=Shewanella sp. NFH-SH190041 TaxID=2950245 RepID=UPI0021C47C65|nr:hypothetical protein [Shewanella sp. NFH-SH190041]BDM64401.1 hypothetical protein NFHSH190041_18530 [Shewanella sp. NFH-SH190041]
MSSEVNWYLEGLKIVAQLAVGAFGAMYGYKSAVRKFSETTKDTDKTVFTSSVTNERAVWRSELRGGIGKYIECSLKFIENTGKLSELSSLKSLIIMRLNPKAWSYSFEHRLDHAVLKSVNSIYATCEKKRLNAEKLKSEIANLEKCAQELLKSEWQKSKKEAVEGRERDT